MRRRPIRGNLPAELSSFVGRRRELTDLSRLLAGQRLVTLTGVGGVGKSRLALRVAATARRSFADGTWLVELASLQDPLLLPNTFAVALGVADQSSRDHMEVLTGFLAGRRVLLVVDNCEHLVPACAWILAELLAAAPDLRVLATSREPLRLPGEQVYPVAPLAVPGADRPMATAGAPYPAVELFLDRARAVSPGFALTDDNAELVADVCRRLDGIPLAIELAASRLYALSLAQLASLLADRFALLNRGNRTAAPRQQALRATVEWSFHLCTKQERLLWVRASVFAGRFDLAAVTRVGAGDGLPAVDVLEALTGLVDKSVLLVEPAPDGQRYRLLETIRQYGLGRLRQPDEADAACGVTTLGEPVLRRRLRDFYLDLADRFHADWFGPRQPEWTRRMRAELPNVRSVLGFCFDTPGETAAGTRLAAALYYFWYGCGEIREGRLWLERALAADRVPGLARTRALAAYGRLLILQSDPVRAAEVARECLATVDAADDAVLGSHALQTLGFGLIYQGELAAGRDTLERALARARTLGPQHRATAFTTFALAFGVLLVDGDPVRAGELLAESRAICRANGDLWWLGNVLTGSVINAVRLGDVARATRYGAEALRASRALHDTQGETSALEALAWAAAAGHDHVRAARLLGVTGRIWHELGGSPFDAGQWREQREACVAATRAGLGPDRYAAETRAGAEFGLDEALGYALGAAPGRRPAEPPAEDERPRLTRREAEIAALVAAGLTNRQIATRLTISPRTAESHVENILAKLGFTARSQIAAWHAEQQPD